MTKLSKIMALAGTALFAGMIPVTAQGLPGELSVANHPVQESDLTGNRLWTVSAPKRFVPTDRNLFRIGQAKAADGAFSLPFSDDFSDGDATRERYTVIDVDGDGSGEGNSVKNRWFWKEDESLIQFCTDNNAPGNDWLMTPAIHLDGKNIYNLEIVVNMGAASNLKLTVGTSTDPATHREIMDLNGIEGYWQTSYKHDFSVGEEGDYYIGIYNYSSKESFYLNLFSISVTAGISSLIPEAPGDFTAVAGENGLLETALSLTVPKALANGTPLTESPDLVIERNDERIYEAKAEPGSSFSWTDKKPVNGENKYKVYAVYDGSEGLSAEKTLWVGTDLPAAPSITDIKTTDRNMKVRIEWTTVNSGMHDGVYFKPENITYAVYRGYSSKEMSPIAAGLKDNVYVDSDIDPELVSRQDSYFYAVAACNEAGATNSSAEIIAVGKPYEVPAHESFAYGQLELSPWLTDPISGSFSWECIHDDTDRGVAAQDGDNGLTRFYAMWGGDTDSRLKSPVFDLSTAHKPMLSFYMFHWEESSVSADNGQTRLVVEVSRDGGRFEAIAEPITAGYSRYGWVEHRFPLDEFKDAETVQFGFRGQTDNSWMYYYIDNIRVEECLSNDIAIEEFYGPSTMHIGEQAVFTVKYINRGTEKAENYTVNLYRDDVPVASVDGVSLESGESKYIGLGFTMNASQVFDLNEFRVDICYAADENTGNNVSSTVTPIIKSSAYPRVTDLSGEVTDGKAVLTWSAPELPGLDPIVDGAEDYEPFATEGFGDWTTIDGDGLSTGYYTDLPEWPGRGGLQAFSVWAPYELDNFDVDSYGYLKPYKGEKCFISWLSNLWNDFWTPPVNDDYLISPEVTGGTEVSCMISCIDSVSTEETYEIMYSVSGTSVDDLILIDQRVAQHDWEKVTFTLPADARFFCIHYTGSEQMGLMVDDISYVPVAGSLKIKGYDVFRNGEKINSALVECTEFTDSSMPDGASAYRVAVVYDRGSSNASRGLTLEKTGIGSTVNDGCTIVAGNGVVTIGTVEPVVVTIHGIDGKAVVNTTVNGRASFNLPAGLYIIRAGEKVVKATV